MAPSRVYVGGLPYGVRERDLERFFKGYGRTRDIMIKNGYGFVEFEDGRDADDAVYDLNGKELMSDKYAKKVVVETARGQAHGGGGNRSDDRGSTSNKGRPPRFGDRYYGPAFSTEFRLFVKNLSSRVNWKDLKDYMRQAGDVTYADAHKQSRNEGVVEFASLADMKNALDKLDDTELYGRRIRLVEDRRRRDRSRSSPSRSRSRSPQRKSSNHKSSSRSSRTKSRSPAKDSRSRSPSSQRDARRRSRSPVDNKERSTRSRSPNADRRSRSRSIVNANTSNAETEQPPAVSDAPDSKELLTDAVAQVADGCSAPVERSRSRSGSEPPAKDADSLSPAPHNNNNNGASSPGSLVY